MTLESSEFFNEGGLLLALPWFSVINKKFMRIFLGVMQKNFNCERKLKIIKQETSGSQFVERWLHKHEDRVLTPG